MKTHRLGALLVLGLLAACGSGDVAEPAADSAEVTASPVDEETAETEPADEPTSDDANDTADANDAAAGNSVVDLGDIPQECRDLLGDVLREIEPIVQDIDWENATMADLAEFGEEIDVPMSEIEVEMDAAGCNDLDFDGDDEGGFELMLELAEQEAPGVVGWLEFILDASNDFDAAVEDTGDEQAAAPENCDEALTAVRDLMDQSETMMDLPVDELLAASTTLQNITMLCSIEEMTALFEDPDFVAWSEG